MNRAAPRRLAWTLLAFVALVGAASANGYYPFGDGLSWTYDSGTTQAMAGPRSLGGVEVMVLTHYLAGVPVSEDYLTFGPHGVATVGTAAAGQVTLYDPPLLIYGPPPLEPGLSWTSTTRLAGIEISLTSEVLGLRGVQTPAGRFNALQIRQRTLTSTGGQTMLDLFLVPGVGIVRFVTQDGTVIDLIERNF